MGGVINCLVKFCCNVDNESSRDMMTHVQSSTVTPVQNWPMTRTGTHAGGSYQTTLSADPSDSEDTLHQASCWRSRNVDSDTVLSSSSQAFFNDGGSSCSENYLSNPHTAGIHEFFRRLRERWRKYDSLVPVRDGTVELDRGNSLLRNSSRTMVTSQDANALKHLILKSPLRLASSFDSSRGILTIPPEQVVLPGSSLQQEMAKTMSLSITERQDDECVICMEGFEPTNPRMPTQCGCGTNKTYFHLPCLYQWIEQSEDCPSCRQKLSWEEF